MIKTHKPRGHFWNCPSVFQQSKEIRNIRFEDCTPPKTKVLVPDEDDTLPTARRAAKRRRIEKLADDFLNGEPLVITSARPHPSILKGVVEGNERSRTGAKYSLPKAELSEDDIPLWIDVDTPAEAAEKAVKARQPGKRADGAKGKRPAVSVEAVETVTEERASSACKQERRSKAIKASLEPSTEAVKQAAALRNRRLQRAATQVPRVSDSDSSDRIEDSEGAEPRSEPGLLARPRYFRNRKPRGTEWLLCRQTTLFELSPDESVDELNRTGFDTPSRSTQVSALLPTGTSSPTYRSARVGSQRASDNTARHQQAAQRAVADDESTSIEEKRGSIGSYQEHWECFSTSHQRPEQSGSAARAFYHTAPEHTNIESYPVEEASQHEPQADSQTLLLRQHGVHAAPRRLWASTNDKVPPPSIDDMEADEAEAHGNTPSAITAIRQSLQESAQHAGKAKKSKRAKSAGNSNQIPSASATANRRRTAPSKSQKAADDMEYLSLEQRRSMDSFRAYTGVKTNDDASPFMFRKAKSRPGTADGIDTSESKQQQGPARRSVKFPSSDDTRHAVKPTDSHVDAQAVSDEAPVLDLSLGNNDSFAPKLHLALMDEHLNTILPADPGSAGKSSGVKKALQQQMRLSNASFERIDGDPTSSQIEGLDEARHLSFEAMHDAFEGREDHSETAADVSEKQPLQTQWPGTQALLDQARQDFFTSPTKPSTWHEPTMIDTPELQRSASQPAPSTTARPPLRELSQEQLPATQALMAGWSPWSTIKKPKGPTTRVATVPPTEVDNSVRKETTTDPVALVGTGAAFTGKTQRRSSLRFSTSTSDSPKQSSRLSYPITKTASQERAKAPASSPGSALKSILRSKRTRQTTMLSDPMPLTWNHGNVERTACVIDDASTEPSTDPATSSFQCAQSRMFREDSHVDQTVDDLTTSVLYMNDMDDVLSQVG